MPRTKLFDEQQVLADAMGLFWKKGFHATSIQDLVNHLGINRGSLYATFGGKQELFDKAFSTYVGNIARFTAAFLNEHASVKEGIHNLFEYAIDSATSDIDAKGCFLVNTTTELSHVDVAMKKRLRDNYERFEKIFFNYLKKGVATGEIGPEKDIGAMASQLFNMYSGIMVIVRVNPDKAKLVRTLEAGLSVLD